MLPTKFRFIWPSRFRGDDFKKSGQSETRSACGGHVCNIVMALDDSILTCFKTRGPKVPTGLLFLFLAYLAKGNVSFCHHLASIIRPLTFHILIFYSETPQPNRTETW
jgi:hypothetical protein